MARPAYHPALLLALLLLTGATYARWQAAIGSATVDFFIVWSVPRVMSFARVSNIYTPEGQQEMASAIARDAASAASAKQKRAASVEFGLSNNRLDAPGSPFLYALTGMASTGDFDVDQRNFAILVLLCFGVSIVLLCRLLRFSGVETILLLLVFSSIFTPTMTDVGAGNINQIQLLFVALFVFFMSRGEWLRAGLAVGLGMALKPNIGLVLASSAILFLVDRQINALARFLAGAGASVALAVAISGVYFGAPGMWLHFVANLPRLLGLSYPLANGNVGLAMLLFGSTDQHASGFILFLLVTAFVAVVVLTRTTAASPDLPVKDGALHDAFAAAGAGCATMILSSNLVWLHYYVLLIPLSLYLIRPSGGQEQSPSEIKRRWLAMSALLMVSTGTMLHDVQTYAVLINLAVIVMLVLVLYETWSRRARPSEAPQPRGRGVRPREKSR